MAKRSSESSNRRLRGIQLLGANWIAWKSPWLERRALPGKRISRPMSFAHLTCNGLPVEMAAFGISVRAFRRYLPNGALGSWFTPSRITPAWSRSVYRSVGHDRKCFGRITRHSERARLHIPPVTPARREQTRGKPTLQTSDAQGPRYAVLVDQSCIRIRMVERCGSGAARGSGEGSSNPNVFIR